MKILIVPSNCTATQCSAQLAPIPSFNDPFLLDKTFHMSSPFPPAFHSLVTLWLRIKENAAKGSAGTVATTAGDIRVVTELWKSPLIESDIPMRIPLRFYEWNHQRICVVGRVAPVACPADLRGSVAALAAVRVGGIRVLRGNRVVRVQFLRGIRVFGLRVLGVVRLHAARLELGAGRTSAYRTYLPASSVRY